MSIMLSWLNTHRLTIVILFISLALISTVVSQDRNSQRDKKWSRKHRRINCAIYVFAPRCRGVSAKRSSSLLYPQTFPVVKDVPEVYQLYKKNLPNEEDDSLSPLPGLVLPNAYSHQTLSQSKLQRLQRLQEEQQEELQKQQQRPMLRSLLRLLLERSEGQREAEETSRSQWSRNLLQDMKRKRRQCARETQFHQVTHTFPDNGEHNLRSTCAECEYDGVQRSAQSDSEVFSSIFYPYKSNEDSQL